MGWLLTLGMKFLSSGALTTIANYLAAKQNATASKFGKFGEVMIATINGEVELRKVQGQVLTTAMGHPIFWLGWIFFVLPVAFYNGSILYVSVFDAHLNVPGCVIPDIGQLVPQGRSMCHYFVRRIPALQESWANTMVMFIFGGQIAVGGFNALVTRLLPSFASRI